MNRPGGTKQNHAIVLGVTPFQEKNYLVHLLTQDEGRITGYARNARASLKRFGPAFEPLNHIKVSLIIPREVEREQEPLWTIQSAELHNSFPHLRHSYQGLESVFFVLRMLRDLTPMQHPDAALFRTLGRFLRDFPEEKALHLWSRVFFWAWFSRHSGYGEPQNTFLKTLVNYHQDIPRLLIACSQAQEPDFLEIFTYLRGIELPPFQLHDEVRVYVEWVKQSALQWPFFETWASEQLSSRSQFL